MNDTKAYFDGLEAAVSILKDERKPYEERIEAAEQLKEYVGHPIVFPAFAQVAAIEPNFVSANERWLHESLRVMALGYLATLPQRIGGPVVLTAITEATKSAFPNIKISAIKAAMAQGVLPHVQKYLEYDVRNKPVEPGMFKQIAYRMAGPTDIFGLADVHHYFEKALPAYNRAVLSLGTVRRVNLSVQANKELHGRPPIRESAQQNEMHEKRKIMQKISRRAVGRRMQEVGRRMGRFLWNRRLPPRKH